jgi:hypothetical protein
MYSHTNKCSMLAVVLPSGVQIWTIFDLKQVCLTASGNYSCCMHMNTICSQYAHVLHWISGSFVSLKSGQTPPKLITCKHVEV